VEVEVGDLGMRYQQPLIESHSSTSLVPAAEGREDR
jgi:hypothetical protein